MSCDRLCIFDTGYRLHIEDTVAGKRFPSFVNTCQHLSTFLNRTMYNTELLAAFMTYKTMTVVIISNVPKYPKLFKTTSTVSFALTNQR